jgi:aminoglycoside phosphotransferase (APT) family kinase protein
MARESIDAELNAAKAVAAKAGLGAVEPELLRLAKHTTVRLAPHPIVARIRSEGPIEDSAASLARELSIASQLAALGSPAVRPVVDVNAGPYLENGCAITLWQLVIGRTVETEFDQLLALRALRQVHLALVQIEADLPEFTVAIDSCETILSDPAEAPKLQSSDRAFLQKLYAHLRQELDGFELTRRPIHGDAHLSNVLITGSGAVWMDFEAVSMGPLEWDVPTLPARAWSEFSDLDPDLMRLLSNLRSLCVSVWCWADFDRSRDVSEAATYHLDRLKRRF